MQWFRLYIEAASDNKFRIAARKTGISIAEALGSWVMLLCVASSSPVRGALFASSTVPYAREDICEMMGTENASALLEAFIDLDMVAEDSGVFFIKNWNKRQYISDHSAYRVKRIRKRPETTKTEEEETADYREYIRGYCDEMGIAETQIDIHKAIDAFHEMRTSGASVEDMRNGIRELMSKNYVIASPSSVIKAAINCTKRKKIAVNLDGYSVA